MIFQGVDVSGSFDITGSFIAPKGAAFPLTASSVQGDMFFHTTFDTLYVFTDSGSWTPIGDITASTPPPQFSTNIEYLVAAGGGGGGSYGGGGAGGYLSSSINSVTSGSTYTITLGAGGAGSGNVYEDGGNAGSNSTIAGSTISTITTIGGGLGGDNNEIPAGDGGSGGGGSDGPTDASGGSGTVGQGNDGGDGSYSDPHYMGGGGGGAGAAGGDGISTGTRTSGAGGAGLASKITGQARFRAGGGGGVRFNTTGTIGAGGAGGGGNGGTWSGGTSAISSATAGTANSGSGGGAGQNGGKGVAIFAYDSGSFSGTGGIKSAREDGYVVHTFNSSGTLAIAGAGEKTIIPSQHFNVLSITAPGSSGTSTQVTGLSFRPDLVWMLPRNQAYYIRVTDSVRGVDKALYLDRPDDENNQGANDWYSVLSFNSNGFNYRDYSQASVTFAVPCWKAGGAAVSNSDGTIASSVSANTTAGFSIVSYTGTGANGTVGHGLSSAPELVINKIRNGGNNTYDSWYTYATSQGNDHYLDIANSNDANTPGEVGYGGGTFWNSTDSTDTVFSVGTIAEVNGSGHSIIAYCFHSVEGYSKIGTYSGSGSSGKTITTGFEPRFVIIKCTTHDSTNWLSFTDAGDSEPPLKRLDTNETEFSGDRIDFIGTGFTIKDGDASRNQSGRSYLYIAIAK